MSPSDQNDDAARLLDVIHALLNESRQHRIQPPEQISLDMDFDRDLGLDSLARVELLSRLEKRFGVTLEDRVFAETRTPRALLEALSRAGHQSVADSPAVSTTVSPEAKPAAVAPRHLQTLVEVLEWHAEQHPERVHIRFHEDDSIGRTISYHGLLSGARKIASGLQSLGLQPGETVILMLETEPDYFFSFFGVLLAGGIPVPIYPPARPDQIEDHLQRQSGILNDCAATMLITLPAGRGIARLLKSRVDSLRQVVTAADIVNATEVPLARPPINAEDIAFLQYTSGSTGDPKGVVLTHANLLANIRAMSTHINAGPDDVFVSWLPLYHDLGLIGGWLGSLCCATELVVMSPIAFITRPRRWLQAMHQHRGTISGAPNFGYELCLRRVDDGELDGIDLGHWRVAFNGAEPVSPDTMLRFGERFSPCGLQPDALMPVYGLAECSVGLTFPPLHRGLLIDRIRREPFQRNGHALPAEPDDPDALRFVSCGVPLAGHEVRIVDTAERELPDRAEGRLQFRGPSATRGYYRNPAATEKLYHGEWLDSGDLAYIANGEVYLTGRARDIIIHAGRNLYPHELEEAIGRIDGIRAGRVAAFGSSDPARGTERLVIVAEARDRDPETQRQLRQHINDTVASLCGSAADDVVLAAPGAILKTPSGKVRRAACRMRYERGDIDQPPLPAWRQLLHVFASALPQRWHRTRRRIKPLLYSLWAHGLLWPFAALTWVMVVAVLPTRPLRWSWIRGVVWLLTRLTAIRVRIHGHEHLPAADRPCIIVANHASYLDAPLLILALPRPAGFVVKAELRKKFLARVFLDRLDAVYVERFKARQGASDAHLLTRRAEAGVTLLFFPEGTFTRAPGLRPFRMGAFIAAAESGTPVFPIALRGTRSLLRDGSRWPSPGTVDIRFLPLIETPALAADADAGHWPQALALRDDARSALLAHCGEPSLSEHQSR